MVKIQTRYETQNQVSSRTMIIRALVIAPVAAVCLWFVITTGLANSQGAHRPELAHKARASDARAAAALGRSILLLAPDRSSIAKARTLALNAFRRDATVLSAYNVLGLAADIAGEKQRAEQIFQYAHRLSRRDLATELWLIEMSVTRNDVPGALKHFDAAMSASEKGWRTLSPILLAALEDPKLVAPIAQMVSKKRWWDLSFQYLVAQKALSLPNAAHFFLQMRRFGDPPGEEALQILVTRLINARLPRQAALLDALMIGKADRGHIRSGAFGAPRGLFPFEWELTQNDKVVAQRAQRLDERENPALMFTVEGGFAQIIGRQLLALQPGAYTLSADTFKEDAYGDWELSWSIICENSPRVAATGVWPLTAHTWVKRAVEFTVPDGCPFQWVVLSANGARDATRLVGWADNIAVAPRLGHK